VYPGLWSGDFLFSADDVANRQTMIHPGSCLPLGSQLTLSNHLGQVVHRQNLVCLENKVDLQGLATGIYLITLTGPQAQTTRKISKQ
jgi:hypothetical protein